MSLNGGDRPAQHHLLAIPSFSNHSFSTLITQSICKPSTKPPPFSYRVFHTYIYFQSHLNAPPSWPPISLQQWNLLPTATNTVSTMATTLASPQTYSTFKNRPSLVSNMVWTLNVILKRGSGQKPQWISTSHFRHGSSERSPAATWGPYTKCLETISLDGHQYVLHISCNYYSCTLNAVQPY